ncbi:hypothetical protein [Streptomyces sp. S.PNR 29]|uniref:hypothetical protein n=1 Tax=Streptomyces sp. S.PNR 29 TaxID=2973805 RepID=UPI0025AF35DC|nr:hypothetical protein [Streptomyces sp. S.PNR 29]MDN0196558.1 hypothetical protein [Streptomyces sp. S.PNR 29]
MSSSRPARPLIAIVGSVDATRTIVPPLKAVDEASDACRRLGQELARANCDVAVFSSKPKYVEADVVRGYAEGCSADNPGRVAAFPPRHRDVDFALPEGSHVTVDVVRDTSGEWEVAYYRTLLKCDGVLLVGGGQSTRVAGIIALAQRIPVLPVAAFGGGASQVWVNLDKVRNDTDDADIALLGGNWAVDTAPRLVECLRRQLQRRDAQTREEEQQRRSAAWASAAGWLVAVLCMCASVAGLVTAGSPREADPHNLSVLVGAPLLAAVAGAVIRNSFETESRWTRACIRGLGAGLVTVLLYVASQLLSVPTLMERLDVRRLLFITIPLGFTAGFTFDLVFERLRSGAAGGAPPGSDLLSTSAPSVGQGQPGG